jgi:hypothetical protein
MECITIIEKASELRIADCSGVVVIQEPRQTVSLESKGDVLVQSSFKTFKFIASEGQEDFEMPSTPDKNSINLFINGIHQDLTDDFTVVGKTITILGGVDAGDKVSGNYAEAV